WFNRGFKSFVRAYERIVTRAVARPWLTLGAFTAIFGASLAIAPLLGMAYFPMTDAGQFVIRFKAPSGTRLEETENEVKRLEAVIRRIIPESELEMIVANVGVDPGFSAIFTTNAAMHTATVQVALAPHPSVGSYEYMARVKQA